MAARLNNPSGVALDLAGDLYIADRENHRLRKVDVTTGNISTVAGTGTASFSGDGGAATSATLNSPRGMSVDSAGNLYIADTLNNRIRRVDATTGNISTFAGTGTSGHSGDGGLATAATFTFPYGVALDGAGNLLIAIGNYRIRRVDATTENISTIAGAGTLGFSGDGGLATAANLDGPRGVAVASDGKVYIADTTNHRIRRLSRLRYTPSRPPVEEEEDGGQGGGADSPVASLSDPGLRQAVEQALGKAPGSVTEADLRGLTSLSADGFGVASLAGLEAASNLERLPAEHVADNHRVLAEDMPWRAPFKPAAGYPPGAAVVVHVEFQSGSHPHMAERLLEYAALLRRDLLRVGAMATVPAHVPLVVYSGRASWSPPLATGCGL